MKQRTPEQQEGYAKSRREWFADQLAHALLSKAGYYRDNALVPSPAPADPELLAFIKHIREDIAPDALAHLKVPTHPVAREIYELAAKGG